MSNRIWYLIIFKSTNVIPSSVASIGSLPNNREQIFELAQNVYLYSGEGKGIKDLKKTISLKLKTSATGEVPTYLFRFDHLDPVLFAAPTETKLLFEQLLSDLGKPSDGLLGDIPE